MNVSLPNSPLRIFREENLITYANKKRKASPVLPRTFPASNHSSLRVFAWLDGTSSRSPVYCYVLFSLLPQILFHCKMMPISKASRRWLWSGSFVVPAGKVIWVGKLFSACDVARNTLGSSHCFIREHINNFHWCMRVYVCTSERERATRRASQSLLGLCVCVCVCLYLHQEETWLFFFSLSRNIQRGRWRVFVRADVCTKTRSRVAHV